MKLLKVYINSFSGLSKEAWMLSIVMLINRSGSMVLPFLGVYMSDKLKFSLEETGFVLSFFGIGAVIGSYIGGFLTDKLGEYKVQTFSLFLGAPLFLVIPLFETVSELAIVILIQSIITETFRPANSVAITKYAKPENLTRAFSLNRMAINLGFSIGPALGGILSSISYNFLFITNFIAILLAGIMYVYFFRKRNIEFRIKFENLKEKLNSNLRDIKVKSPYLDIPFLVFCFFCTTFSICFFQILNTLPLFYKEVVGLDKTAIGFILGYSGFLIVIIEMILVNAAEKYLSIAKTLLIGTVLCAIGYSILGINSAILMLLISISIISIGEILVLPFMSTVTAIRSLKGNKGAYMGLNGIAFSLSFIITPLLGTKIAFNYGYSVLWYCTGIVLLLTAFGLYFVTKIIKK